VLGGDPAPSAKRTQQPPSFRPMSIVDTVAHLSYCSALVKTSLTSQYAGTILFTVFVVHAVTEIGEVWQQISRRGIFRMR